MSSYRGLFHHFRRRFSRMFTRTAQDWTRRSREDRRFMLINRKAVRKTHTKKLAQMNTAAMETQTTITSQAIAVIITSKLGIIHNIIKLRNVAQLQILTGRFWPQNPKLLPINRGLVLDKGPILIPPSRQVPTHYRVPTDHPRNLFLLQKDETENAELSALGSFLFRTKTRIHTATRRIFACNKMNVKGNRFKMSKKTQHMNASSSFIEI